MDAERLLRIQVDVVLDHEPIAGRLRVEGASATDFTGVLELIRLLDRARDDAQSTTGAPQP